MADSAMADALKAFRSHTASVLRSFEAPPVTRWERICHWLRHHTPRVHLGPCSW